MIKNKVDNIFHEPVMVSEVIEYLRVKKLAHLKSQVLIIDATLGSAGHSIEIIKEGGKVLGIELDPNMLEVSRKRLNKACPILNKKVQDCFRIVNGNFKEIDKIAESEDFSKVDGIIFDLGVSNLHFESFDRGFSFKNKDALLDMRIDKESQNVSASDLINALRNDQLTKLFSKVYSENISKKIAQKIIEVRDNNKIRTVGDFLDTLEGIRTLKRIAPASKLHPATKAMLALRMAVNSELESLDEAIPKAFSLLTKGGRLLVISFHSGEDQIVKKHFLSLAKKGSAKLVTKKPIKPKEEEISNNPKSRSARLRVIEKL